MATKKDIIIIPRIKKFIRKKKISFKKRNPYTFYFFLIFFLFAGLLVLITHLPISNSLKILGLLIGSFLLEDLLHSLKKMYYSEIEQ